MTAVATKTLKEYFSLTQVEALGKGDPDWLLEARRTGWAAWEAGTKDNQALMEHSGSRWLAEVRTAPHWNLDPGPRLALPQRFQPNLGLHEWGELEGSRCFANGQDFGGSLSEEAKAEGVLFCSLKKGLELRPELLKAHLFSRTSTNETSFAGLNAAYFGDGNLIYVPKGVKLVRPLLIQGVHLGGQPGFFPRTLVILEEGAELTLIDESYSGSEAPGFMSAVSELIVGSGAKLSYISRQDLNHQSGSVSRQTTILGREAYLYTLGLTIGSAWSSAYIGSRLEGEGAHVDLLGLLLVGGAQRSEIRTLQDHVGRAGQSDALVKAILRGAARSYFDGVVRIFKSGQGSNAFQSNPNLLLSSEARAESVPTLEIEADDVACKHAASIGSINEEERFYLLSRGISETDTETMIVEGFAAELAQRLPSEALQEHFVQVLSRIAAHA